MTKRMKTRWRHERDFRNVVVNYYLQVKIGKFWISTFIINGEKNFDDGEWDVSLSCFQNSDFRGRWGFPTLKSAKEWADSQIMAESDQGYSIVIEQPGSRTLFVRTPTGPATALIAPDDSLLLDDGCGNWMRAVCRNVDDVEVWSISTRSKR